MPDTGSFARTPSFRPPKLIRAALGFLFSFEFIFSVFLFAGVLKENPQLAWLPVDLTAAAFSLSVLAGIIVLARRGFRIPRAIVPLLLAMAALSAWAFITLAWTPGLSYGTSKAFYLGTLCFWSLFGCGVVMAGKPRRLQRFLGSTILLAVWMTVKFLTILIQGTILEDLEFASQYLSLGRLAGVSVIALACCLLWARMKKRDTFLVAVLGLAMLALLLSMGGRGPFLGVLLALLIPLFRDSDLLQGKARLRSLVFFLFLPAIFAGFLIFADQFLGLATLERLDFLFNQGGDASSRGRVWFYGQAWEYWKTAPLIGHGIGSFGPLIGHGDVTVYPHNILLEILVELGVVGMILFGALMVSGVGHVTWRRIHDDPWLTLGIMLLINAFFNTMVTGDLAGNRILFAMLGVLAGLEIRTRNSASRFLSPPQASSSHKGAASR